MINRWIWQYTPFLDKPMRSKQRSTKIRVPPISLSYTGYCVYIYSISHFLYPRFLMDFSIPHFFYFIHMKKHMPIPAPLGSVLDLFKSCGGHAEACASWGSRWQSLVLFLSSRPVGDDASGWRVFSPQELVFNIV